MRRGLGFFGALALTGVLVAAALLLMRSSSLHVSMPVAAPPSDPTVTARAAIVIAPAPSAPITAAAEPAASRPPVVTLPPATEDKQTVRQRSAARPATARALPKRSAAAGETCRVTLGTRPWAEVWIDGRKMPWHTPFTDTVKCGTHTVMFKRADLQLARSFKVTLYPGEPFKQSFSLSE
jgi:hypothetical protein